MSQAKSFEDICQVFRALFASDYGKISAVFRSISGIYTGHDGAEIHLEREGWTIDGFPNVYDGHNGEWDFYLREDPFLHDTYRFKANFKTDGEVVLSRQGFWEGAFYADAPKT